MEDYGTGTLNPKVVYLQLPPCLQVRHCQTFRKCTNPDLQWTSEEVNEYVLDPTLLTSRTEWTPTGNHMDIYRTGIPTPKTVTLPTQYSPSKVLVCKLLWSIFDAPENTGSSFQCIVVKTVQMTSSRWYSNRYPGNDLEVLFSNIPQVSFLVIRPVSDS